MTSTITKQEADQQSELATQQSLIDLGAKIALKEKKKEEEQKLYENHRRNINYFMYHSNQEIFEKYSITYSPINSEIYKIDDEIKKEEMELYRWSNPTPPRFSTDTWKSNTLRIKEKIKDLSVKKDSLVTQPSDIQFYSVMESIRKIILNTDNHITFLNKNIETLKSDLKDRDDEITETTDELDELEKEKNKELSQATLRIKNLRDKCMDRNKTIYYMKLGLAFQLFLLITISIFGFKSHVDFMYYGIIYPVFTLVNSYISMMIWIVKTTWYYTKCGIYMSSNYIVNNTEL